MFRFPNYCYKMYRFPKQLYNFVDLNFSYFIQMTIFLSKMLTLVEGNFPFTFWCLNRIRASTGMLLSFLFLTVQLMLYFA